MGFLLTMGCVLHRTRVRTQDICGNRTFLKGTDTLCVLVVLGVVDLSEALGRGAIVQRLV